MIKGNPVYNQILKHSLFEEKGVKVSVKRLDKIHPQVSGNKFFKLKYNLEKAKTEGQNTILTFGGAFSNHIAAVAFATKAEGLNSIGIIRGEKILPLNNTLKMAQSNGMKLFFISRESYRNKTETSFLNELKSKFGDFFMIPEGGTNELAISGTSEILEKADQEYSHILASIGTGGTFAGLVKSLLNHQTLIGISALKGNFIHQEIEDLLKTHQIFPQGNTQIMDSFHFGGYAKYKKELIDFIWRFYEDFGITLDPIYTGKLFFGVWEMITNNQFKKDSSLLIIHSGGLQGNIGFTEMTGIKLPPLSA
ncbi:1-aminocyclopropane-1-carboxylate deaminase/D-cysteine desulfhydrase [Algoriphagus sp.]|uniref:1-aminocyclopropane-1-carboxylate deaminase/D-cysteine desulfhydrase n=1 Tax=Algoriphagus sp. TaxID=1872435 RepID=UPI0025E30FC3|nr:pyridoxal-phosphate dependent enzyme [Algoriphagus sp.]